MARATPAIESARVERLDCAQAAQRRRPERNFHFLRSIQLLVSVVVAAVAAAPTAATTEKPPWEPPKCQTAPLVVVVFVYQRNLHAYLTSRKANPSNQIGKCLPFTVLICRMSRHLTPEAIRVSGCRQASSELINEMNKKKKKDDDLPTKQQTMMTNLT